MNLNKKIIFFLASSFFSFTLASAELEEIIIYSSLNKQIEGDFIGSLSLISGDQIANTNIQHIDQVLMRSPNTNFSGGASRGRFVQIRGIGDLEQFVDPKAYPSVGLSVDGIELNGLFSSGLLFDTKQVEILRGPQGTRLGAAASAGAINIISNDYKESDNQWSYGLGKFNSYQTGAIFNTSLSENISARTSIQKHYSDGFISNDFLNIKNTGKFDELNLKTNIFWNLNKDNNLKLTLLHVDSDNGYDAFSLGNTGFNTQSDQPGYDRQKINSFSLSSINKLSEDLKIESKLTSSDIKLDYGLDEDWTDQNICTPPEVTCNWGSFIGFDRYQRDRNDMSFDMRIVGEEFLAGIYFQNQDTHLDRNRTGSYPAVLNSDYYIKRRAIYSQWNPKVSNNINLLLGARLENFSDSYNDTNIQSETSDTLYSAETGMSFSFDDNEISLLASRSIKPGGVNTDATSNIDLVNASFRDELLDRLRYEKEVLTNLEFIFKTSYLGSNITTTWFYNHRVNPQFETFLYDHIESFLFIGYQANANESKSHGLEIEFEKSLNHSFVINSALSFIDSQINDLRVYDFDQYGYTNIDSKEQPRAASYQYHIDLNYKISENSKTSLQIEGRDDYEYAYYFNERSKNINLVHLSFEYRNELVTFTAWARNILDKEYPIHALYFGNDPRDDYTNNLYTQLGEPRNIGVNIKHKF